MPNFMTFLKSLPDVYAYFNREIIFSDTMSCLILIIAQQHTKRKAIVYNLIYKKSHSVKKSEIFLLPMNLNNQTVRAIFHSLILSHYLLRCYRFIAYQL